MKSGVVSLIRKLHRNPHYLSGVGGRFGVFRGFVEDVVDPQQRGRVRVRVPHVHGNVPIYGLPWAERCFPDGGGAGYGDFIPLRGPSGLGALDGDRVWVIFEGGDISCPVIIGTWPSIPNGASDVPADAKAATTSDGHLRRRIMETRHGHKFEMGDDRGNAEIKIRTARGDVLHFRESDGGRGIHLTTAEGHSLSLQDENPGSGGTPAENVLDETPDRSVTTPTLAQPIDAPAAGVANGEVQSPTSGVGTGFGQKGIMLRTSGGHEVLLRDTSSPGILIKTNAGYKAEFSDNDHKITVSTPAGQSIELKDNGMEVTVTAIQRVIINGGLSVDLRAGATINCVAGVSINFAAPFISLESLNSFITAQNGIITFGARGINLVKAP